MSFVLRCNEKHVRAEIIKRYMEQAGYSGAVCFTCGNAARALRSVGVEVLEVGPCGPLAPQGWWSPAAIRRAWPHLFDATSGHLPAPLMVDVARALREAVGALPETEVISVPTGSGETLACLQWAYPHCQFKPVADGTPATERHPGASLLALLPWRAVRPRGKR